jgi:quercetin dioxygenase-like cupin family protein
MEIELLNTKPFIRRTRRTINSSLRTFDLPALIDKLKHENTWVNGELNSMILLKRPEKQIILATLHEGTEIKSFQSNDSITFQIIEGKLKFHGQDETIILEKGQLMTLHDNISYSLTSKEETVLLLTISNGILQSVK